MFVEGAGSCTSPLLLVRVSFSRTHAGCATRSRSGALKRMAQVRARDLLLAFHRCERPAPHGRRASLLPITLPRVARGQRADGDHAAHVRPAVLAPRSTKAGEVDLPTRALVPQPSTKPRMESQMAPAVVVHASLALPEGRSTAKKVTGSPACTVVKPSFRTSWPRPSPFRSIAGSTRSRPCCAKALPQQMVQQPGNILAHIRGKWPAPDRSVCSPWAWPCPRRAVGSPCPAQPPGRRHWRPPQRDTGLRLQWASR